MGNASPKPCDKTKTFAALTWGQGEALANIYLGYDFHIVAATWGQGEALANIYLGYDSHIVAATWGQGEALANIYLGYDSHIVVANASPLQQLSKSQISRLFLFV
ncbi:hypothetical protein BCD67_19360 [Oscillatoriales cyanobacterium USR001]|nr:hypothetical protein BCD67_19360 [Oscillatoriales cyanobacterium USR001]